MVPRTVRGKLFKTFFREDVGEVPVRTFLDVFEGVDGFVSEGFLSEAGGRCLENGNVFGKGIDLWEIIGEYDHVADRLLAEMGIIEMERAARFRTSVKTKLACSPIDSRVMISKPIDSDNHLLGLAEICDKKPFETNVSLNCDTELNLMGDAAVSVGGSIGVVNNLRVGKGREGKSVFFSEIAGNKGGGGARIQKSVDSECFVGVDSVNDNFDIWEVTVGRGLKEDFWLNFVDL